MPIIRFLPRGAEDELSWCSFGKADRLRTGARRVRGQQTVGRCPSPFPDRVSLHPRLGRLIHLGIGRLGIGYDSGVGGRRVHGPEEFSL